MHMPRNSIRSVTQNEESILGCLADAELNIGRNRVCGVRVRCLNPAAIVSDFWEGGWFA